MAAPRTATGVGIAVLAASLVACAGIVGADFDAVHADAVNGTDGSSITTTDAQGPADDGPHGVLPSDGGTCPTRFLDCSGECFDISTSPTHCGNCTTSCAGDPHGAAVCVASHCELACNDGYEQCPSGGAAACCFIGATDGSSSTDASGVDAASVDSGVDSGPAPAGIPCADAVCSSATEFCCVGAATGDGGDVCIDDSVENAQCNYYFGCAGTADCASSGGICCYDSNTDPDGEDPNYQSSYCDTVSDCENNEYSEYDYQLCYPGANDCLEGTSCTGTLSGAGLPSSYAYCVPD